jgi:hypothetical protein
VEDRADLGQASGLIVRNNIFESIGGLNSSLGYADGAKIYNNLWRSDYTIPHYYSGPGVILANANNVEVEIICSLMVSRVFHSLM